MLIKFSIKCSDYRRNSVTDRATIILTTKFIFGGSLLDGSLPRHGIEHCVPEGQPTITRQTARFGNLVDYALNLITRGFLQSFAN